MTPTDMFFYIVPPSNVDSPNEVQSLVTGAADSQDLWSGLDAADIPPGSVFVCIEALTADCYVRFGNTVTTGTTANNGLIVKAGQPGRLFYLNPTKHKYMDVFAASAGVVKWQVCSPPGQRDRQ